MNTIVTMKNQFISHGNVQLQQFSLKLMTSSKLKNKIMPKPITIWRNF